MGDDDAKVCSSIHIVNHAYVSELRPVAPPDADYRTVGGRQLLPVRYPKEGAVHHKYHASAALARLQDSKTQPRPSCTEVSGRRAFLMYAVACWCATLQQCGSCGDIRVCLEPILELCPAKTCKVSGRHSMVRHDRRSDAAQGSRATGQYVILPCRPQMQTMHATATAC